MGEVADRTRQRIEELPADLSGRPWAKAALPALVPLNPQRRQQVFATLHIGELGLHNPDLRAA